MDFLSTTLTRCRHVLAGLQANQYGEKVVLQLQDLRLDPTSCKAIAEDSPSGEVEVYIVPGESTIL